MVWRMGCQLLETPSLYEQAVEAIKRLIVDEQFRPNDRLPPEDQLASKLGFSRTIVREAVKHLEARGILEVRQGQGTFVREPELTAKVDELSLLVGWDASWLRELIEMRTVLEVGIADLVIARISEAELAAMSTSIIRSRRRLAAGDLDISQEDLDFHLAYLHAARNRAISGHGMVLRQFFLTPELRPKQITAEQVQTSIEEHIAIHEAILRGDAERLRSVVRVHLERRMHEAEANGSL